MSTSKELVELNELYGKIQLNEFFWKNKKKTEKDIEDEKNEKELETTLKNLKNNNNNDKDDKEEVQGPNITNSSKNNNNKKEVDLTNTTSNNNSSKTNNTSNSNSSKTNNNDKPPITVEIKDKSGKVIGTKKITSNSSEYDSASQGKGTVSAPSEMGTDVKGIDVKSGGIVKKQSENEVKPETYLGKEQGLLNKADWLKKTANSPAAKAGKFSDDQRWAIQLKHRQWQKDNNRGAFKVQKQPKQQELLNKADWLKKTANSPAAKSGKFTDDQRWAQQQKHRQWKQDRVQTPKVETPKVEIPKVETKVETPTKKVEKKVVTQQNKVTTESYGTGTKEPKVIEKDRAPKVIEKDRVPKVETKVPKVETRVPKVETKVPKTNKTETPKVEEAPKGSEPNKGSTPSVPDVGSNEPKVKKGTGKARKESYDAYDLVLNYIMETEQASSIEEANYIMIEMDQNTIHEIVQAQKKSLDEGLVKLAGLGAAGYGLWKAGKWAKKKGDKALDDARKNMKIGGENRKKEIEKKSGVDLDNW